MNKPKGYVCSAVSDSHKTVYQLLPNELQDLVQNAKRGERLHTVGRLDCETSGLLLITNDGDFSHKLTDPQNKIEKTYLVTLAHSVTKDDAARYVKEVAAGVILPPEKKAPEEKSAPGKLEFTTGTGLPEKLEFTMGSDLPVNCTDYKNCKITVTEGKFHEVRRIFRALGNEVINLKRIKLGNYELPLELKEGSYIIINKI